jgi:hypothetical protein
LDLILQPERAMTKLTDERIQNILRNKAGEIEAAKQAQKQAEELAILKDFEQKMSDLNVHLAFQDEGQQGAMLAVGRVTGRVSGHDLSVTFHVDPNGEIHIFSLSPLRIFNFRGPVSVLSADKALYEDLILNFIEGAA